MSAPTPTGATPTGATLSTHVLNTADGTPAAGVRVRLLAGGQPIAEAVTDADGRIRDFGTVPLPETVSVAFGTGEWWAARGVAGFYPEVVITVVLGDAGHVHVPLLLSPFGYTTYRGS